MRTEFDITVQWRNLFEGGNLSKKAIEQAQQLLDDLPSESPLRLRLANELNELRTIADKR